MFKRTKVSAAASVLLGGMAALVALPTMAQEAQRIEITGSAIKRVDAEGAIPITVLKLDDLKAQGITTVEQIMTSLTAVQVTQGTSQQVGSGTGGAAFADLRGIGNNKTLVLLNSRRIANNAVDGSAPDLNMIPFAAIERVEVLRDGASSLYGTDAIGGVINFITRKDFQGGVITIGADIPAEKGGKGKQANVGFGFGDLSKQGFNVFGFIDINKTDPIGGEQRPFNNRFPGGLSGTPFPANYFQGGESGNPAAPDCSDPSFLVQPGDGTSCQIATARFVDYTAKTERTSAMLRGTLALGSDHSLALEWFRTESKSTTRIAPVPYAGLFQNPFEADGVTPNRYYPGNSGNSFTPNIPLDPTYTQTNMTPRPGVVLQPGFVNVRWRALAGGQRTSIADNKQERLLAQIDGVLAGWDYQGGLSYNENKVKENVTGYSDGNKITQGVLNGVINPYGAQDAAGEAFIADALLGGNLQNHRGRVAQADARVSREFGDWFSAGRKAALAVGAELRKEDFLSAANPPVAELLVASTGVDPTSRSAGERKVGGLYAELNLPLSKMLDFTAALRYDKYSDFGNSTNPKFTLRFQPNKELLFRGSYSTGFRAPSLYELNASEAYTNTGTIDDPVNCPSDTNGDGRNDPIPGKSATLYCQIQIQSLTGGNKALKPEKSKNLSFGLVFEPTQNLSLSLDLWWVRLEDTIDALSETTILGDEATFAQYVFRNPSGDYSISSFDCPGASCGYVDTRQQNLGNTTTRGADLSALYRLGLGSMGKLSLGLNTTYVTKYQYQNFIGGPYVQRVSRYNGENGPIFRWQHAATATWNVGNFTIGAVGRYKSSYVDQDPADNPRVKAYTTVDTYVTWAATKGLSLTLGVNNLNDRDPPYSNQGEVFQANYDPRFYDPTGRKYYARASYQF